MSEDVGEHTVVEVAEAIEGREFLVTAYILWKARSEALVAREALIDVDPDNVQGIMRLQNEVKRHRELVHWLREVMDNAQFETNPEQLSPEILQEIREGIGIDRPFYE